MSYLHQSASVTTSSGSDPDQKNGNGTSQRNERFEARRSKSLSRQSGRNLKKIEKFESDSTDEYSIGSDDSKQKAELTSTRNQMAAARLQNTETKLADFNSKLSQRKDKLEELHLKLKIRKEKLLEREDRLRKFEKVIMEKEAQMKKKEVDLETFSKVLKGKEGLMFDYESSLNHRASKLEEKEKYHSIHINSSGIYEKMEQRPKPILNQDSRKMKKIQENSKRISWADSAISSSGSPSQDTSSDDDSIHKLSVSQRLKRFENRQLL